MTTPPDQMEIFDRRLRRRRRDRAFVAYADHAFLRDHIIESLLDRLDTVTRPFTRALDLGCADGGLTGALRARGLDVVAADAGLRFADAAGGVQCDEDRLPFADASFDLVMSAGVLDQVNDLPGALALIRRILKPDGLFLAGFVGGGSLPVLRASLIAGDMAAGGAVGARIHPQVDLRGAADLLSRAGFALPVADGEPLDVRYGDALRLMADLRGMGVGNLLRGQGIAPFSRTALGGALAAFAGHAGGDGRVTERFELLYLTGWAPAPSQPRPARRGSATRSLASELGQREKGR